VLDPFAGTGTTGMVSNQNRRNAIQIELNPDNRQQQQRRLNGAQIRIL